MSAVGWTPIKDALHTWLRVASGLAADHVLWWGQGMVRPTGQWISMHVIAVQRVGQDWTNVEPNPTPSPGAEILRVVQGSRQARISIQCFAGGTADENDPAAVLNDCITALELPSRRRAFRAARVAVGEVGPVNSIGGVMNSTRFEPRAVVEVTLLFAAELSETDTYFENATLEMRATAGDVTIVTSDLIPDAPSSGTASIRLGAVTATGAGSVTP